MRLNAQTTLVGKKCVLVPYTGRDAAGVDGAASEKAGTTGKDLVPVYHSWMKSAEIQELTCSEPLSLEEEYAMCKSWQEDANKLTFIVCARVSGSEKGLLSPDALPEREEVETLLPVADGQNATGSKARAPVVHRGETFRVKTGGSGSDSDSAAEKTEELTLFPCGDVNMYYDSSADKDPVEYGDHADSAAQTVFAEIECMTAESCCRRRGIAAEAVELMLGFVRGKAAEARSGSGGSSSGVDGANPAEDLQDLRYVRAKILEQNTGSIALFEKRLGFEEYCRKEIFGEVWLVREI